MGANIRQPLTPSRLVALLALLAFVACPGPAAAQPNPLQRYNTALAFYKQQRWDLAARTFERFLAEQPESDAAPKATYYRGVSLLQARRDEEARDAFEAFLARYPADETAPQVRYRLGETYNLLGEAAKAADMLSKLLASSPPPPLRRSVQLELGEALLRAKRPAEAVGPLQDLVDDADAPSAARMLARITLGRALASSGRVDDGIVQLQTAVDQATGARQTEARSTLGRTLFNAGQFDRSQKVFDDLASATTGTPTAAEASLSAGYAAYKARRFSDAVTRFDRASRDESTRTRADYWAAMSLKNDGQYAAAAARFDVAARTDPESTLVDDALYQSGEAAAMAGQTDDALARLTELIDRFPDSPQAPAAAYRATTIAVQSGRLDDADKLNDVFESRFADSPLAPAQSLLAARIRLARTDGRELSDDDAAAIGSQLRGLLDQPSEVSAAARVLLARLQQRTGRNEAMLETLRPLLDGVDGDDIDPGLRNEARLLAAAERIRRSEPAPAASLLRSIGDDPTAQLLLAQAEAMQGNFEAAEAAVAAGQLRPLADRVATLDDLASLAYDAEAFDWAARWFARAIDLDKQAPTDRRVGLLSGLGFALRELGRHEDAAATFAELAPLAEGNPPLASQVAYLRAVSLQQIGETEAARQLYETASAKYATDQPATQPDEIETAWNAYRLAKGAARIAVDQGRIDDAAGHYETAAAQLLKLPEDRQADVAPLLYEFGNVLQQAERFEPAAAVYARLATLRPDSKYADEAALFQAENLYFGDEAQQPEAERLLAELVARDDASPAIRQRAGQLLLDRRTETGDWDGVVSLADTLAGLTPKPVDAAYAQFTKANAQLRLGQLDKASATASELTDRIAADLADLDEPWVDDGWVILVESLVRQKRYDQADAAAARFAEVRPSQTATLAAAKIDEAIGRSLRSRARFDEARERLQQVTSSEAAAGTETAAKAQLQIAESHFNEEDWEEALTEYFTLYANYPYPNYQAPALLQAAACDELQGRFRDAVRTYRTLLDEFPESDAASDAADRMKAAESRL